MATDDVYKKVYKIVTEKMCTLEGQVNALQAENTQLKNELAIANAKLEIYDRIASISDSKATLGFGPPIKRDDR